MKNLEDPFRVGLAMVAELKKQTACILVDMHCETTSEKNAMGAYLDGKVSGSSGPILTSRPPMSAFSPVEPLSSPTWEWWGRSIR